MKKRKKLTKRLLAFLLTAAFMLSSLSLSAFAETSDDGSSDAEAVSADDDVSTAADETVSLTIGDTYEIEVSGQHSADEYTGYDSNIISVSVSVSTTVTAGTMCDSLSDGTSFYIYYTQNGTTYYLVLSYSNGSLTVSTTSDISEATLITYSSSGYLSFTSDSTTYYLNVQTSNDSPGGSSVSLTASTTASTTWSYSSSTGFSTSVTTSSGGPSNDSGSTTTTYYLSGSGLSSSTSTYNYAISYSTSYTTTVTITGLAEGTTSITVGNTTYSIAVTSVYELDLSAYRGNAYVYWDMDDSDSSVYGTVTTTTDDDGNTVVDTGASAYISSVTLASTNYTGASTQSVTNFDSTNSNFDATGTGSEGNTGDTDAYEDKENDIDWTETAELSSVYLDSSGTAIADGTSTTAATEASATLTITPADGYYVTSVVVACAAYVEPVNKRVSPYLCSTYTDGKAYEGTFSLSSTSDAALELSTSISNKYFSHSGYENYTWDKEDDDSSSNDCVGSAPVVYFILITVEEIPTPAYVEYDFGDIVTYITDELGESSKNYSAFSTASDWTDASDKNVYSDNQYSSSNTGGTQGGKINGGVLTDDTQFEYVYQPDEDEDDATDSGSTDDNSTDESTSGENTSGYSSSSVDTAAASDTAGAADDVTAIDGEDGEADGGTTDDKSTDDESTDDTETGDDADLPGYKNWVHYTNSINEAAEEQALAAGYVFAGWAVTYYSTATATATNNSYNSYSISFSDASENYSSLVGEGTELTIIGNVRLVAQWIKIDSAQVIDYGLPVAVDVEEALLDDAVFEAITSDVTSRTSVTQTYNGDNMTTKDLSDSVTADVSIATDTDSTTTTTGDYGTITISSTSSGDTVTTADSADASTVTYTLSEEMTGVDDFSYTITLKYNSTTIVSNQAGTLYIIPATSMYYEEDFGVTFENYKVTTSTENENGTTSSTTTTYQTVKSKGLITYSMGAVYWIQEGSSEDYTQETGIVGTEDDSTYGADASYLTNLKDSNGTSMYADVTGDYDATFSYSFTGTGTAIYARTSNNSAYIGVVVKDNSNVVVDTKYIDTRVVENADTYSSSSNETTLYNIPVYELTDQDWGTYTVTVTVYDDDTPVNGWYTTSTTTDENGNETTTKTLVEDSDESGNEFYLDGIRIYDPLGTGEAADKTTDSDSTTTATNCGDDYVIALAAYKEDVEAYHTEINISDKLEKDIESDYLNDSTDSEGDSSGEDSTESTDSENDSSSDTFVTITDVDGNITSYSSYFDIGPDNELYLYGSSNSSDDADAADNSGTEESTTYTVTFYLLNWDADEYDVYLGLKAPLGTSSSVEIGKTTVTISGSADCYYQLDDYISTTTEDVTLTSDDSSTEATATKVTITGVSGLTALTWLKVTGDSETTNVAYASDITVESETESGETTESLVIEENTVYLVSATTYASLTADDKTTDEEMLDDDAMGVDPEDSKDEEDSAEPETKENESSVFEPETFSASISYLKLLRYASITVRASSDVSYITVNGEVITGRTFMNRNTKTFNYTASRVSSGTTFEIIAYDSDGTASEPITLTAK